MKNPMLGPKIIYLIVGSTRKMATHVYVRYWAYVFSAYRYWDSHSNLRKHDISFLR
jgi:ADP-glucose pyrophosphorylase